MEESDEAVSYSSVLNHVTTIIISVTRPQLGVTYYSDVELRLWPSLTLAEPLISPYVQPCSDL